MYSKTLAKQIIDLRKQNKSIKEISAITGKTETGLRVWLSVHKIYKSDNKIKVIDQLSNEELAYIAGIIDGEGSIVISKLKAKDRNVYNDEYQLFMKVVNTDKRLITFLANKTLTPFISEKYRTNKPNSRLTYAIHWPVNITIYLLKKIYPFLIIKQEQVDLALRFRKTFLKKYCRGKVPEYIMKERIACYLKMKELHKREFI